MLFLERKKPGALYFTTKKDTSFITSEVIKLGGSPSQKINFFVSKENLAKLSATESASRNSVIYRSVAFLERI
jgi:hypothetical protein